MTFARSPILPRVLFPALASLTLLVVAIGWRSGAI